MTRIWNLIFYPPEGESHSPVDVLKKDLQRNEQVLVKRRLDTVAQLEIQEWPTQRVKKIGNVYQGYAKNVRYYFGIHERTLIVCHICRKQRWKAKREDLFRAEANFRNYLDNI